MQTVLYLPKKPISGTHKIFYIIPWKIPKTLFLQDMQPGFKQPLTNMGRVGIDNYKGPILFDESSRVESSSYGICRGKLNRPR